MKMYSIIILLFHIEISIQKLLSFNYTYIWNTPSAVIYFDRDNITFKAYSIRKIGINISFKVAFSNGNETSNLG